MKRLKAIYARLRRTVKYSASDPENFEERWSFQSNSIRLISLIFIVFILVGWLAVYLFSSGPLSGFLGHERVNRSKLEDQSVQIEQLTKKVQAQEDYIDNIRKIFTDQIPIESVSDTIVDIPNMDPSNLKSDETSIEKKLSKEVSNDMSTPINRDAALRYFGSPVKGVVSQKFSSKNHPGIDVVTSPGYTVKSCLGGTVLYAGYSRKDGYVLIIGHPGNYTSVYKHNKRLIKKAGDRVQLGDPIAIVGNSGENSDGPHLHFELWYNQEPVDPSKYMSFKK